MLAPWLMLAAINLLLFVPSFVCSEPASNFWPFSPGHHKYGAYGFNLYSARQYLLSLFVRRANLDVFRLSLDLLLLAAVAVLTARMRWRVVPRVLGAVYVVCLLAFLSYHHAVTHFFVRIPALREDIRLALNLAHLAGSMLAPWQLALGGVAIVAFLIALGVTTAVSLRAIQDQAARWPRRSRIWFCALVCVPLLSLGWFGVDRDEPVVQLLSKRGLYNWRASRAEAQRLAELREPHPDRRYDGYKHIELKRKPTFYLLMIEAYGEILSTWDMTDAYRALLARVESRLGAAGYHARTVYSASPVHGGTSWFSIATVQTGILIDRPIAHGALENVGARVPSLTRFFDDHGYPTYTLQPGTTNRTGVKALDLFNHDVVLNRAAIDYQGRPFGWGVVPDQYSLGLFRERYPAQQGEPRFLFYMSVSTHWPWGAEVPPYVRDWHALQRGVIEPSDVDETWPALPGKDEIATAYRISYVRSVEYEWRILTDLLEAEPPGDIVVLIVGDHQPRLEWDVPGLITMNTPVHVLSRDPDFVERFAPFGFQPGLYADPAATKPIDHAGLFSLMISQLSAAYGVEGSAPVPIYPHGIRLSGLDR